MSESTVTTPVATRLYNAEVAELRDLANAHRRPMAQLIAEAIRDKLPERRSAA